MTAALLKLPIPFLEARHYTPAHRTACDLVVLHSMESAELQRTAENVASWFAGSSAPKASAHYCVDADSVIQCVHDEDIAWAAPGANARGLQVELAGRAAQTAEQWADDYSAAMLSRAIELVELLCRRWSIPARHVGVDGLVLGHRGITTHAEVSRVFKRSTHTDPGPGFPLEWFVGRVSARLAEAGR